jgi:aminoglycoside phosphotransferase (APT) family kinase protein
VLRVLKSGGDVVTLTRLKAFLAGIDGRAAVATPLIEKIDARGRYTVERRLPGTAMVALLPGLKGDHRQRAFANYVAAAEALAGIEFPDRPYGQILAPAPIRAETWTGYLRHSLDRARLRNGAVIAGEVGDVEDLRAKALVLLEPLAPRPPKALVHGDYFPGNVLLDGVQRVTAIVDFSTYTMVGDPLYDMVTAAIFVEMVDRITDDDVAAVRGLVNARLGEAIKPAARFYRVHAAFVMADPAFAAPPYPKLYPWALATLRQFAWDVLPE